MPGFSDRIRSRFLRTSRRGRRPARGTPLGVERLDARQMLSVNAPALLRDINTRLAYTLPGEEVRTLSSSPPAGQGQRYIATVGNTTYFTATDGIMGTALWKTDGTTAGTVLVKDVAPGPGETEGAPYDLVAIGSRLFFRSEGFLWTSDGTGAGTARVTDGKNRPLALLSGRILAGEDGAAYFAACPLDESGAGDAFGGLWRAGAAGPVASRVNFYTDETLSLSTSGGGPPDAPVDFTIAGSTIYYTYGPHSLLLGATNLATNEAVLLKDFSSLQPPGDSAPSGGGYGALDLRAADGVLLVTVRPALYGGGGTVPWQLWKSDGTPGGTARVCLPIVDDVARDPAYARWTDVTVVNSRILLTQTDERSLAYPARTYFRAARLYALDGDRADPLHTGPRPVGVTSMQSGKFFYFKDHVEQDRVGRDGVSKERIRTERLWRTDGTAQGTVLLHGGGVLNIEATVGPYLFFTDYGDSATVSPGKWGAGEDMYTKSLGQRLWRTDGTPEGTVCIEDGTLTPARYFRQVTACGDGVIYSTQYATAYVATDYGPRASQVLDQLSYADGRLGRAKWLAPAGPVDDNGWNVFGNQSAVLGDNVVAFMWDAAHGNEPRVLPLSRITNPDDRPPTDIRLESSGMSATTTVGDIVGTLSTVDGNVGDTFTYELLAPGRGPDDLRSVDELVDFEVHGNKLVLKRAIALQDGTELDGGDRPTAATVIVRSIDSSGFILVKKIDVPYARPRPNAAPTAVALANVIASLPADTSTAARIKLADIVVTDDGAGTNSITLAGADALLFEVMGTSLYLRAGVSLDDPARTSYGVTVRVADDSLAGSKPATVAYKLSVGGMASPLRVEAVRMPEGRAWREGDVLRFTVVLSHRVTVVGRPTIDIVAGTGAKAAVYAGGSGTKTLVFQYTVKAGDNAASVVLGKAIRLPNGGTAIRDASGRSLPPAIPGGRLTGASFDTIAPAVTAVAAPAPGIYRPGDVLRFTVTLSEAVAVRATPFLTLTLDKQATRRATYVSGSGMRTLTFEYRVQAGDTAAKGLRLAAAIGLGAARITDTAGNDAVATTRPPSLARVVIVPGAARAAAFARPL